MAIKELNKDEVIGAECRHVVYCQSQDPDSKDDLLMIKENIHMADGTKKPGIRFVKNYERNFWITREGFRNHNDKKTGERIERLQKFSCTQSQLPRAIANALRMFSPNMSLRYLSRNPYLYGADITTPTLMKQEYKLANPELLSLNTVAVLDIETDVVYGTDDMISVSLTFGKKAVLVWNDYFVKKAGIEDIAAASQKMFDKYLKEVKDKRGIEMEVVIADTPGQAVVEVMKRAHKWKPDFISIWNMDFDLPRLIKHLEREHIDPAQVFSDPNVPEEFKFARYKQGPSQKVTVSGKTMSLHPADRWHTLFCPASFYFIDSMCLYKKLRLAKGNQPSYALDYILNKHLGIRKLKFTQADHLVGLKWHQFMQSKYLVEYGIYNLFDCISVEMLDAENGDLSSTISVLGGISEYDRFGSQPRRIADNLHFVYQESNHVIGTTSDDMVEELDKYVLPMTDWIVTLPSYLVEDNGHKALKELPNVRTLIRTHVSDLDVEGAYPTGEIIMNISKETTARELCKFRGVSDMSQRRCGINLTGGTVNSAEISQDIFGAPSFTTLLDGFVNHQPIETLAHADDDVKAPGYWDKTNVA